MVWKSFTSSTPVRPSRILLLPQPGFWMESLVIPGTTPNCCRGFCVRRQSNEKAIHRLDPAVIGRRYGVNANCGALRMQESAAKFFRAPAFFPRANETIHYQCPGSVSVAILRNKLSVSATRLQVDH